MLYDKKGKELIHHSKDDTMKKPTLSQRLDKLTEVVIDGFKQVNVRIDRLENRVDNLTSDVNSLKQDVKTINARINRIDARIDRIDARIDRIDARLDYNSLKRLPK